MNEETILIIDDDPSTTRLLEVLLTREGYKIETENLSQNAIQRTKDALPHLVILDLMMPGIDGMTVCRQMKADPDLEQIPVIMFSAVNQPEITEQAYESGINDYITKPIHPQELTDRIRKWLDQQEDKN